MKKKILGVFSLMIMCGFLFGCGSKTISEEEFLQMVPISETSVGQLYSNVDDFVGERYDFIGQVFNIEVDEDGDTILQVWQDIVNSENNTIVVISGSADVEYDDYISVSGLISGEYEGTNLFGGTVYAPVVSARSYDIVDYITAVAPTKHTIAVEDTINQHDLEVTLNKIEFADLETRVYITIYNGTSEEANFYSFNSYLIQGKTQFEEEWNWEYEDIPSDIQPGVEVSGIIVFPPMNPGDGPITAQIDAYYWDWDVDFELYVFADLE